MIFLSTFIIEGILNFKYKLVKINILFFFFFLISNSWFSQKRTLSCSEECCSKEYSNKQITLRINGFLQNKQNAVGRLTQERLIFTYLINVCANIYVRNQTICCSMLLYLLHLKLFKDWKVDIWSFFSTDLINVIWYDNKANIYLVFTSCHSE